MMATGPEHYREAQEWLTIAANVAGESVEERALAAACAQAHATLALAAATALATTGVGEADLGEWTALICEPEPTDDEDEQLADWERELLANSVDPSPEREAANAAELALAEAHHTADHDMATCTECRDQWEAEQAEDGEAMYSEAESEAAQEAWIAQGERAVDEALDARDAESGS